MPNLSTVMSKHSGRNTDLTWTEDSERNPEARSASGGAVRSPTAFSLSGDNNSANDSRVRLNDNTETDGNSNTRKNPLDDEEFRMPHSSRQAAREARAETTEGSSGHDAFGTRDVRLSVHDTKRRLHDYAEDERVHGEDAGTNLRDSGSKGSNLWRGDGKSGKSIDESDSSSGAGRAGGSIGDADRRSSFNIRARRPSSMDDDDADFARDLDDDNEKPTLRERAAGAVEGMRQYFHEVKENVGEKVEDAKEKLSEMKDGAKDKADDLRESASDKYENAKQSVNKGARDAKDKASEMKDRASDKADQMERKAERNVESAKRAADRDETDKEHPQVDAGAGKIRPFASQYKSDHNAPTQADLKPTGRTPATPAASNSASRSSGADRDEENDDDTRNEGETLSQKAQNAKDTIKDKAAQLKEKAVDAKDNLKDKMRSSKEDAEDKVEDAKDKAREVKRDAKSKARETERDAKDKAADLKEDAKDKAQDAKNKAKEVSRDAQRGGKSDKDEDQDQDESEDDEHSAKEKDGKSNKDPKEGKEERTLDDMVFENTPDSMEGGADAAVTAPGDAMNRGSGNEHLIRDYMRSSRHDHVDDDMEGVKQVAREMADTEDGRTNENVRRVARSPIRGEERESLGPFARLRRFFGRSRSRSADRERDTARGVGMPPRRGDAQDRDADRDRDSAPRRNVDTNMTSPAARPGIGEIERGELGGTFTPMDRTFTPVRDSRSGDRDTDRDVITVTAEDSGRQANAAVNAPTPSPMDVSRSEEGIADLTDLSDPLAEAGAMLERQAAQMLQRRRAGSGAASMA